MHLFFLKSGAKMKENRNFCDQALVREANSGKIS